MKRYTLSFIVLLIAVGIPLLLINPSEKAAMSRDGRITRDTLSATITRAI